MPIRPIDIMRSQEVSQMKQLENQKTHHDQVQISTHFQDVIKQESNKTLKSSKSENDEYKYDAKEKGNNKYFNSKKNKKQEEENKKEQEPSRKSGGFDILI